METFSRYLILFFLLSISLLTYSNPSGNESPVRWTCWAEHLSGNEFMLNFEAQLKEGWYIYSPNYAGGTAMPTEVNIETPEFITQVGDLTEQGVLITYNDPDLKEEVKKFADHASFRLIVKTQKRITQVSGKVEYMTCDDMRCLPPAEHPFSFSLAVPEFSSELPSITPLSSVGDYAPLETPKYAADDIVRTNGQFIHSQQPSSVRIDAAGNKKNQDFVISDSSIGKTLNVEQLFTAASIAAAVHTQAEAQHKKAQQQEEARLLAKQQQQEAEYRAKTEELAKLNPVQWAFEMLPTDDSGVYRLIFNADIIADWHLYGMNNGDGNAPASLRFHFEQPQGIEFLEPEIVAVTVPEKQIDPLFKKEVETYTQKISFSRLVRFNENVPLSGSVSFMTANDEVYKPIRNLSFTFNQSKNIVPATQSQQANLIYIALAVFAAAVGVALARFWQHKTTAKSA